MEIKCKKCNKKPKIEIFDDIQSVRFICDDINYTHYGMLSINNFYKNFVHNYEENLFDFINEYKNNSYNTDLYDPAINEFLQFQIEFNNLLEKLTFEYQNIVNYFNKILFIKNQIYYPNGKNKNNENGNIYTNSDILEEFNNFIEKIKSKLLIFESYPKIKKNIEIEDEINSYTSNTIRSFDEYFENLKVLETDFEYENYIKNISNILIKKKFKFTGPFHLNQILIKLNSEKFYPAKFIYSYTFSNYMDSKTNSYINIYEKELNKLFELKFEDKKITNLLELKDGDIILIEDKKIIIININIFKKTYTIIQTISKSSNKIVPFYDKLNTCLFLLNTVPQKNCFYMKNYLLSDEYFYQEITNNNDIIQKGEIYIKNDSNFIVLNYGMIYFYLSSFKYDKNKNCIMEIKNNGNMKLKGYVYKGVHWINEDLFLVCNLNELCIVTYDKKEIIAIYNNIPACRILNGNNGECYLIFEVKNKRKNLLKQIYICKDNEIENKFKGEVIEIGGCVLDNFDFSMDNNFIDIGEYICYF